MLLNLLFLRTKKKQHNSLSPKRDIFEISYYNYNKKSYYSKDNMKNLATILAISILMTTSLKANTSI